ncbi:MAG: FKBP-type peptidyl-prolyl cis-trans isomerase [Mariprofundus sp.]|nr:FKBP-type peptidyl-prolyl cis-trans isomerase [Mariprofundus sp.]
MKKIMMIACVAILAACSQKAEEPAKVAALTLDNDKAKISYAIGLDIGQSLQSLATDLDRAVLIAAINDRLDGGEVKLTAEDAGKVKQDFFKKQAEKRKAEQKLAREKNITEGKAFLLANSKKPGVVTTASGLQYEVIKQGKGDKPIATDKVTVNYKGSLIDGTEFDSSYKRGKPATFLLNGVVKGWIEGVQLMPVGSTFKFVLPSDLAYGERGAGAKIRPDTVLVFEVELLAIDDAKPAKSTKTK